jgi:hypothetical protein
MYLCGSMTYSISYNHSNLGSTECNVCIYVCMYMFVKLLNYVIIVPYMYVAVRGLVMFSELLYVKCDMSYIQRSY